MRLTSPTRVYDLVSDNRPVRPGLTNRTCVWARAASAAPLLMAMLMLMLIVPLTSCGSRDQPLQVLESTTWISDRAGTLHWIAVHRPNLVANHRLASLFGSMTIRYSDASVVMSINGNTVVRQHRVLGQTSREIAIITYDLLQKRDIIITLEIDSDRRGYWVYSSQFDIKEHFIPMRTVGSARGTPSAP